MLQLFRDYATKVMDIKDMDTGIYLSQYLRDRHEYNSEQTIWFSFLCSLTYHVPSAFAIFNRYPDCELVDINHLSTWWETAQYQTPFQTDKLKQRKFLPESVQSYQNLTNPSQTSYFNSLLNSLSPSQNFQSFWDNFKVKHCGRFTKWNFAQYLCHICSYKIFPSTFFFGAPDSESITVGACFALDHLDWIDVEKQKYKQSLSQQQVSLLESEAMSLLSSIAMQDYWYFESTLCAFHKLFRNTKDSRYLSYYIDRLYQDILSVQDKPTHYGVDWSVLHDFFRETMTVQPCGRLQTEMFVKSVQEKINFRCY